MKTQITDLKVEDQQYLLGMQDALYALEAGMGKLEYDEPDYDQRYLALSNMYDDVRSKRDEFKTKMLKGRF